MVIVGIDTHSQKGSPVLIYLSGTETPLFHPSSCSKKNDYLIAISKITLTGAKATT